MPIRKGKRLLRIAEKARKRLEQERRRSEAAIESARSNRERVSKLQAEEAITRKSESEEKVWRDFDEGKAKIAEGKAETIGQDIKDIPTVNETVQVFLNKNPENKLSLTEMISGLTQGTKPLVNIKTLDVDLEGIKKLAENLARKKNPNFNKLNRDKQIEIYRSMLAQQGTLLNRAKLFKDANRLKAFQASPTKRTREEFYESEEGKEFAPDPDAIKTPRPRYIEGEKEPSSTMFKKTGDEAISDEDIISIYGDKVPYTTRAYNQDIYTKGMHPYEPPKKGQRLYTDIDRKALERNLRQNFRGLPKPDQAIPQSTKPEPFLETIKSPYRNPQTGKEIFPSQYDDPYAAELIASGRIDEGLLGSKNPYTDTEVVSESLDLRKNSDRLRGKEISDDIPQDQVIKLQQTNLVEVQGNKLVWTKTADKYNKKVLERDHKKYIDGLIKKGFAKKVKDKKTGKTKVVYTSSFDDYLRRQTVTQRGESSPGQADEPYRVPEEDKYFKGGRISINETGNLKPSELEEFLNKQGYKVNFKYGGKIKTKSRPKPKILQDGRVSNNKRPLGGGVARCGFGAVRRV
jgi:hypothetical protein